MEEKCLSSYSEEKSLILVQAVHGPWELHSYVVDLKAQKLSTTPVAILLNEYGIGDVVRLGSFIYNIGGCTTAKPKVYDLFRTSGHHIHLGTSYFEFSTSQLVSLLKDCDDPLKSKSIEWNDAPGLDDNLVGLRCASLGDKIYALGGCEPKWDIFKEFSPLSGQWEPLPHLPHDLPPRKFWASFPIIPDEDNERLLVHFFNACALYAYYPGKKTWSCLASFFPEWRPACALVDGVLYAHVQGQLYCLVAYDLSSKSWLEVVYSSRFPLEVCKYDFIDMFHLGNGILCLANSPPSFEENKYKHSNFYFFKFTVKRTNLTQVQVTPADINCFPFPRDKRVRATRFFAV